MNTLCFAAVSLLFFIAFSAQVSAADSGLCTMREQRYCGSNLGACRNGIMFCLPNNTWGDCANGIMPSLELCDSVDNDCDGVVDNGCVMRIQANCNEGLIQPLGCFCGGSFHQNGYCQGNKYIKEPPQDHIWLYLLMAGISMLCLLPVMIFISNRAGVDKPDE